MAYYQRIRDLREDSDKKQSDIAHYLNTTTQYYSRYEHGEAEIPFERAILLAKYYNVSLDYIAGLTNNKRGLASSDLSDSEQQLLRFVTSLSNEEKKLLSRLAELIDKI